ncbi:hypothetical protein K438DRAFT_1757937 [Mycena galopus ATCC 62051]|nr:hypothetical protein K438DRAFT_1757937 [Mycena galopus ATCC 62051]
MFSKLCSSPTGLQPGNLKNYDHNAMLIVVHGAAILETLQVCGFYEEAVVNPWEVTLLLHLFSPFWLKCHTDGCNHGIFVGASTVNCGYIHTAVVDVPKAHLGYIQNIDGCNKSIMPSPRGTVWAKSNSSKRYSTGTVEFKQEVQCRRGRIQARGTAWAWSKLSTGYSVGAVKFKQRVQCGRGFKQGVRCGHGWIQAKGTVQAQACPEWRAGSWSQNGPCRAPKSPKRAAQVQAII